MSETSETKEPHYGESMGQCVARLEAENAELMAALNEPVPCGVLLTHWERVEIERSAICMEGMIRDPVFGEDYAKRAAVFRDLLARTAQSGEVVAVRREVLEALHDCTQFLVYPPNEATQKLFAEAEAALAEGDKSE